MTFSMDAKVETKVDYGSCVYSLYADGKCILCGKFGESGQYRRCPKNVICMERVVLFEGRCSKLPELDDLNMSLATGEPIKTSVGDVISEHLSWDHKPIHDPGCPCGDCDTIDFHGHGHLVIQEATP